MVTMTFDSGGHTITISDNIRGPTRLFTARISLTRFDNNTARFIRNSPIKGYAMKISLIPLSAIISASDTFAQVIPEAPH
jgi:hypothetical protein